MDVLKKVVAKPGWITSHVVAALERARPRDQHERQSIAKARLADGDDRIRSGLDLHRGRPCAGRL